jgi:hypothetical protein
MIQPLMHQTDAQLSSEEDDAALLALVLQGWFFYLSTYHLWGAHHLLVATAEGGSRSGIPKYLINPMCKF